MSRYYSNYTQYLGSQRCCNLRTQGQSGPTGPTGPAGIGERGWTGPTGAGSAGPTGPTGPPSTEVTNYLYPNPNETTTINPTFYKLSLSPPTLTTDLSSNTSLIGSSSISPVPVYAGPAVTDPNGIQYFTPPDYDIPNILPLANWILNVSLNTDVLNTFVY